MELPGPVKKKSEEDDESKILRYVTVTPATAKRDSSVRMGKVTLGASLLCGSVVSSQCSSLNRSGDTLHPSGCLPGAAVPLLAAPRQPGLAARGEGGAGVLPLPLLPLQQDCPGQALHYHQVAAGWWQ